MNTELIIYQEGVAEALQLDARQQTLIALPLEDAASPIEPHATQPESRPTTAEGVPPPAAGGGGVQHDGEQLPTAEGPALRVPDAGGGVDGDGVVAVRQVEPLNFDYGSLQPA